MLQKKKNKKFISTLLLMIVFFSGILLFANHYVAASDFTLGFDDGETLQRTTKLGNNDPATITYGIVNWALIFLGLATVIMIIIAGFMWLFAAGNEEQVKKAQAILKGAIIGLLVIMASYGAANYIFTKIVEITTPDEIIIQPAADSMTIEPAAE